MNENGAFNFFFFFFFLLNLEKKWKEKPTLAPKPWQERDKAQRATWFYFYLLSSLHRIQSCAPFLGDCLSWRKRYAFTLLSRLSQMLQSGCNKLLRGHTRHWSCDSFRPDRSYLKLPRTRKKWMKTKIFCTFGYLTEQHIRPVVIGDLFISYMSSYRNDFLCIASFLPLFSAASALKLRTPLVSNF